MRRRLTSGALLALAVALVASVPAPAKKGFPIGTYVVRYGVESTIELSNTATVDTVHGVLSSRKTRCKANRPVSVVQRPPNGGISDDVPVGTAVTDASGNWSQTVPGGILTGYGYFAIVRSKRLRKTRKHQYNCGSWVTEAVTG